MRERGSGVEGSRRKEARWGLLAFMHDHDLGARLVEDALLVRSVGASTRDPLPHELPQLLQRGVAYVEDEVLDLAEARDKELVQLEAVPDERREGRETEREGEEEGGRGTGE